MASQEAHLRGMGQYEHFVKEFKRSLSESLDTEELDPLMRRESARALVAQFEIDMRHAKTSHQYDLDLLEQDNIELKRTMETFRDCFKDLKVQHAIETGFVRHLCLLVALRGSVCDETIEANRTLQNQNSKLLERNRVLEETLVPEQAQVAKLLREVKSMVHSVAKSSNDCTAVFMDGLQELQQTAGRLVGSHQHRDTVWMGNHLASPSPVKRSSTSGFSLAEELTDYAKEETAVTALKDLEASMKQEAYELRSALKATQIPREDPNTATAILAAIQDLRSKMKEETDQIRSAVRILETRVSASSLESMDSEIRGLTIRFYPIAVEVVLPMVMEGAKTLVGAFVPPEALAMAVVVSIALLYHVWFAVAQMMSSTFL